MSNTVNIGGKYQEVASGKTPVLQSAIAQVLPETGQAITTSGRYIDHKMK